MIYWILILLFLLIKIAFGSVVFRKREVEEIDKFIYALLYRGYAEEGPVGNGELSIIMKNRDISLIKYKEKGKIGIYILIYTDEIAKGKKEIFEKGLNERGIEYYEREFKKPAYLIDMGTDIERIKETIRFLGEKIYEKWDKVSLVFIDICEDINKIIDYEDTKELEEKGIDIRIPTVVWQWLLWKIRNPRGKI